MGAEKFSQTNIEDLFIEEFMHSEATTYCLKTQ